MDVIHYSEDIGDQLLEWMAAGEHMLTNDNVDRYFDRITDFYANYDYDSIYEWRDVSESHDSLMTAGQDGVPASRGRGKPVNIKTEKENEHENL